MTQKNEPVGGALCSLLNVYKGQTVVDGAGVRINRIIGSHRLGHIDPFVLLDEIRSDNPADYISGFPTHPHRGIETITYMLHGKFRHRDSRGGGGLLTDGCVQWMTAGRGILHSEMPEAVDGEACGYQLWLSLPAAMKMVEPRYQHLTPEMMPVVKKEGLLIRIISGAYDGVSGPAGNLVPSHYFDVEIMPGGSFIFELDPDMNSFCYLHSGSLDLCGGNDARHVTDRSLLEFGSGRRIELTGGASGARLLFLAARPNREAIVRGGPFVMNSREEIEQAFADYEQGRLY